MAERINLRLLEVFRAVIDASGVTEASEALNVSQPAVSKAISQLERNLGLRLFGRRHGRLFPTSDAMALYTESERLFAQLSTFRDRLSRLNAAQTGRLVVSAIPTLAASVVSHAVGRFGATRPEVKIEVVVSGAAAVAEAVGHHRCDFGLVHSPVTDRTVTGEIIGESEIVAVMAKDHPMASHKTLSPRDLYNVPLLMNDTGSPPTHLVYETFSAARAPFQVALEVNSSAVANAAALAGRGIALIDPWPNHPVGVPGLVLREFRPRVPLRIVLLHSMFRPLSRVAEAFRAEVIAVLKEASKTNPFIRSRSTPIAKERTGSH
jgi:DNA-binding transcriptional LysR family regulator